MIPSYILVPNRNFGFELNYTNFGPKTGETYKKRKYIRITASNIKNISEKTSQTISKYMKFNLKFRQKMLKL